jgi:hypothetical protein
LEFNEGRAQVKNKYFFVFWATQKPNHL